MAWDKEVLTKLYCEELKTLQEIGDIFGVSRERIRQVIKRFGLTTSRARHPKRRDKGQLRFKTLDGYLANVAKKGYKWISQRTVRKYLPTEMSCAECHRVLPVNKLNIHHIVYPAKSINDIRILCPACHTSWHRHQMTFAKQVDVYTRYIQGEEMQSLADWYSIPLYSVDLIVRKIGNNCTTAHETAQKLTAKEIRERET